MMRLAHKLLSALVQAEKLTEAPVLGSEQFRFRTQPVGVTVHISPGMPKTSREHPMIADSGHFVAFNLIHKTLTSIAGIA